MDIKEAYFAAAVVVSLLMSAVVMVPAMGMQSFITNSVSPVNCICIAGIYGFYHKSLEGY